MTYIWKIKDKEPVGKIIEVIVAPEDLGKPMTYLDTVKAVANLKDWHGYNGCDFKKDTELLESLENDSYSGGWFVPPKDLLLDMYKYKDETYKTSSSDYAAWYWSASEYRESPDHVWVVRFSDGNGDWFLKDYNRLSCRPVRVGRG